MSASEPFGSVGSFELGLVATCGLNAFRRGSMQQICVPWRPLQPGTTSAKRLMELFGIGMCVEVSLEELQELGDFQQKG